MSEESDYFDDLGMTKVRYNFVFDSLDEKLTSQEVKDGWFFSDEFDGLLVNKAWPEGQDD